MHRCCEKMMVLQGKMMVLQGKWIVQSNPQRLLRGLVYNRGCPVASIHPVVSPRSVMASLQKGRGYNHIADKSSPDLTKFYP
jgi:hypothetical protein